MKFKPYKNEKLAVKIPITILTPKIPGKINSIFYAGKDIARVKILGTFFTLTSSGFYKFSLDGKTHQFDTGDRLPKIISSLTDAKIKAQVNEENWGWFTVKISTDDAIGHTEEVYSTYDEAIKSFIAFVGLYINS